MFPFYIGTFFVSFATLVIEISLTRIFSVTIWYHFAFMVISIVLFGFGASGAFLTIFKGILKRDANRVTTFLAIFLSIMCIVSIFIISHISLDPFQIANNPANILRLFIYYAVLTIPFFLSGLCISFLLSRIPDEAGKIYFYNLAGSGVGCFAVIFMISLFSPAGAIVCAAIFVLIAALFFNFNTSKKTAALILGLIVLQFFLMINSTTLFNFKIADSKALSRDLYESKLKPLLTKWNIYSRLDVLEDENKFYAPGLSSKYVLSSFPRQMFIYIDADAIAPITRIKKGDKPQFFKYIPSSIVYRLKSNPTVCIIGAGGGFDVLTALSTTDPAHVVAVEVNSDISKIVRSDFNEFSGFIYNLPNVSLQNAEGRNFIRNSNENFDIIQISMVDTWAAVSSGAYSLIENYLYTEEAFTDYINHLSQDGILTVTRWFLIPPKESLRLAALAISSLKSIGVKKPENNIVFIQSERVAVLLLKKTEFCQSEIKKIQNLSDEFGFKVLYAPYITDDNIFYTFIRYDNKNLFYELYPFNIEPPTDDKPFYFHSYNWKNIDVSKVWRLSSIDRNNISYLILLFLLVQAAILSVVFIFVPLVFLKRDGISKILSERFFLLYFSCLGLGFMFVEVTLIQKFILFLGHPVYSVSVVLSSLLVFAGLGSLYTARISRNYVRKLRVVLCVLVVLLFVYSPLLTKVSHIFLGWHLIARFTISILLIAPLGVLMGMPFPIGIRLVDKADSRLLPWVWAINGCFSVLSSIVSVIIAMSLGFSAVLKCAAIAYIFAIIAIQRQYFYTAALPKVLSFKQ